MADAALPRATRETRSAPDARAARMRVLPCGERAVLVECADLAAVLALSDAVAAARRVAPWNDRIVDVVPAACTLLLVLAEPRWVEPAAEWIAAPGGTAGRPPGGIGSTAPRHEYLPQSYESPVAHGGRLLNPSEDPPFRPGDAEEVVEIGVRYDGPDLTEVARLTGLGEDEVVAAHTGTPWRVAFTGFAPGFGYLVGGDPRLAVPRRPTPRPSVPAGSVGLADEFSGVYPRSSPGGWQLIGRTDAVLWDAARTPPALLRPGVHVRFVALDQGSVS